MALGEDRTMDGTANNQNPERGDWGAAGTQFKRIGPAEYGGDGMGDTLGGQGRPHARVISNTLMNQTELVWDADGLTDWVWQWGQFMDHDMDATPVGTPPEFANIVVPQPDPVFGNDPVPITFVRSAVMPGTGVDGKPREQVNNITAWIDGSAVYGSSDEEMAALRTNNGSGAYMRTSPHPTGDLLPTVQDGLGGFFFLAGDHRVNEQIGLIVTHTLFVREHNYQVDRLKADPANAGMSDEELFQRARRIVGAIMQNITYNEWLPALLGEDAMPSDVKYDDTVNPAISNEFATALFRFGHTMLAEQIRRVDNDRMSIDAGDAFLSTAFFNPTEITNNGGIGPILKGLASQRKQEVDAKITDEVRNFLFGFDGATGGFDLASLNIQRGRDHGLCDYNDAREAFGLTRVNSFDDISSDPEVVSALRSLYGQTDGQDNVNNIDLWVGALAEDHYPGSRVGELVHYAMLDQFVRLCKGDRFYFEWDSGLDQQTLDEIRGTTLADVIRRNSEITNIQDNVFFYPCGNDFNTNGQSSVGDILDYIDVWQAGDRSADTDLDGLIRVVDILEFLGEWMYGCD